MNKLVITCCFLAMSVFLHGQRIIVQSTNKDAAPLIERYKKSPEIISAINKLKNVINDNPDYSGKNMSVVVKVTFYNPSKISFLPLNRADVYSEETLLDGVNRGNQIMLHFLFAEERSGKNTKITFTDFRYQESGGSEQVPELVANYIQEQILKKQNSDDVEAIVKKGLNAVKNAFDRRFQQKLIERAPKMLDCRYYFRKYSCISTYSYYLRNETTNRDADLQQPLVYLDQNNYHNVYLKNWQNTQAKVFDKLFGHELSLDESFDETLQQDMFYINNGKDFTDINALNLSFNTESLFDYANTGLSSLNEVLQAKDGSPQVLVFDFVNRLQNSKNTLTIDYSKYGQLTDLLQDGKTIPVSHNTLYVLMKNYIIGPKTAELKAAIDISNATILTDTLVWGHPSWKNSYPTWCNVFAQYLSHHIYGTINDDFLVPYEKWGKSANSLFDYFNKSPHCIPLDKSKSDEIWTKYIDKGYPVYFSWKNPNPKNSGHIETGFPSSSGVGIFNKKSFEGVSSQTSLLLSGDTKYMVGAGGTVGFKSFGGYATNFTNEATPFLALQYLSIEY